MLSKEQWEAREQEIAELKKQLKELDEQRKTKKSEYLDKQRMALAKKIHIYKNSLNQHQKLSPRGIRTNTEVYKMFVKPLKELTNEEYKVYYNARQKINRQKRKEKASKSKKEES